MAMPDAVFGVTPNPPGWYAVSTIEEYHSKASFVAAAAIVVHVFSATAQDGIHDGFIHMLHVAKARGC